MSTARVEERNDAMGEVFGALAYMKARWAYEEWVEDNRSAFITLEEFQRESEEEDRRTDLYLDVFREHGCVRCGTESNALQMGFGQMYQCRVCGVDGLCMGHFINEDIRLVDVCDMCRNIQNGGC